jgi:radical SAM-linked protein
LNETISVLIKFGVYGNIRFLSHAETVRVFERACIRAGIDLRYSCGFNPRPKLSLPLPKSVGVESDDELLCLGVNRARLPKEPNLQSLIKAVLAGQMPQGLELLEVCIAGKKESFQPEAATYIFTVGQEELNEDLNSRIKRLLAGQSLDIRRRKGGKSSEFKNIDVRGFLKSIKLAGADITVECRISSAGSIRVDELLELLGLDAEKLAAPIRRTNIKWQQTVKN